MLSQIIQSIAENSEWGTDGHQLISETVTARQLLVSRKLVEYYKICLLPFVLIW